ncbi:ABC transporter permease [Nitrosomonas ureae]|uniref:FtsX-like permease family protein n=1 Tax=Nitrosomonas ureae TaxID=44577 RepID=A0A2T5IGI2_9PROT|nr:FtsX-like permease family protein [Nitrosomonas ureae]PTQ82902.1 FtsX-like permease family protein [Nitrosomonas ureae]PXX11662.1 FtsX-like permease family protein [Nitrosomonas ureae]
MARKAQRQINPYAKEPLLAILPGVTLTELWQMMRAIESTLQLISYLVLFSALLGLITMLLSSMSARRREIAIMRAIGASPSFIFLIIQVEAFLISIAGIIIALVAISMGVLFSQTYLAENYGIVINYFSMNSQMLIIVSVVLFSTFLLATIPAISAYRMALHDSLGMTT